MKRLMLAMFLVAFCCACPAQTTTPNIHLTLPNFRQPRWDVPLNNNFMQIDSLLSGNTPLPAPAIQEYTNAPGPNPLPAFGKAGRLAIVTDSSGVSCTAPGIYRVLCEDTGTSWIVLSNPQVISTSLIRSTNDTAPAPSGFIQLADLDAICWPALGGGGFQCLDFDKPNSRFRFSSDAELQNLKINGKVSHVGSVDTAGDQGVPAIVSKQDEAFKLAAIPLTLLTTAQAALGSYYRASCDITVLGVGAAGNLACHVHWTNEAGVAKDVIVGTTVDTTVLGNQNGAISPNVIHFQTGGASLVQYEVTLAGGAGVSYSAHLRLEYLGK